MPSNQTVRKYKATRRRKNRGPNSWHSPDWYPVYSSKVMLGRRIAKKQLREKQTNKKYDKGSKSSSSSSAVKAPKAAHKYKQKTAI